MAEDKGRGTCDCCGKDCKITADGKIWHHHPEGENAADCYSGPDSKRCKGAGQLPAGAKTEPDGSEIRFLCRVPSGPEGCGHQVQLTANRRARSHLTPHGTPCGEGGSAFPIAVGPDGYRADTADWTDEDWERVFPRPQLPVSRTNTARQVETLDLPHDRQGESNVAAQGPASDGHDLDPDTLLTDPAHDPATCPQCLEDPDYCPSSDLNNSGPVPQLDPVECACNLQWASAEAMRQAGHDDMDCESAPMVQPAGPDAAEYDDLVFDVTHRHTDASGTEWIHPGEAGDCRLPGCCTHPRGFTYMDDDNGHSGSFCRLCGTEEPEDPPVPEPEPSPVCALGELDTGVLFVRHTLKPPLNQLVYRMQQVDEIATVIVVSAGPYAGRTGELTNLSEEITCTDLDGHVRERKGLRPDPGTASTSPSSPGGSGETGQRMPSLRPSTPSAPAPTAPEAAPPTSNERPEHSGLSATAPTTGSRSTPSAPAPTAQPTTPARPTDRRSGPRSTASAPNPSASPAARSSRGATSGPTEKAAGSTRSAPVTDAFSTAKQTEAETDKYDRYGRYKLTHPDTGKPVKWTRATTFAKSIQDTFALSQWAQRMTLKGAALRKDIVAAVSTLDVKKDKDRVNALVEDAKKAAGNKVAANLGTAVHAFTEDRDRALVGMPVKMRAVPDDLMPSVDAYEQILSSFGLRPVPGLIEFTTAVKQYEIAGTSDRCYLVTRDITFKLNGRTLTLYAGEYVIGDVKTGAQLDYGWMEICIQLAIYAQGLNTSGAWDWGTGRWGKPVLPDNPEVLLKVRTDVAIIAHLPVDREDDAPLATLYAIDLDEGWAAAVLCAQVRTTRKKGSKLATALTVADVADPHDVNPDTDVPNAVHARTAVASRPPTLEERARAVTSQAAASEIWKEATAARLPKAEVDKLVQIMKTKLTSHVEQGA